MLDYTIVLFFVGVTFLIGIWASRNNRTLDDYFLGGREFPWWLLLGSIIATETSVVTFLSIPGSVAIAGGNLDFIQLTFGFAIGRILVALCFVPRLFTGTRFSIYELTGQRFGRQIQRVASTTFLFARTLSDGLRLYLAALVLQVVFGIRLEICVLICGILTITYTWLGGFRGVVLNDCLQLLIYTLAGITAWFVLVGTLGWDAIYQYGITEGKWHWLSLSTNFTQKYTLWSGIYGGMFLSLATHGADQMMAQRYLAARTQREAALAVGLSGFVVIGQFLFFLLLGVGLGLWKQQMLPDVDLNADQIFAKFMVLGLPSGLTGLALAGVAAAAMSTLSSSLNSSATTFMADWLGYNDHEKEKPQQAPRLSRWLTAVFGGIQMCVALLAGWCFTPDSSVVTGVMGVASYTTGLLLGLLVLCFYPRQLSSRSVMAAFLVGLIAMTLIRFLTDIAWPWHALLGTAFVAGFGILFSALFHGRSPLDRSSRGTNL
ncbi:MAG: transporter, partial [Planctomycetota bacterium]|nr:transporter [Planctomycetota bacterium]